MTITPHSDNHLLAIPPSPLGANFGLLSQMPGFSKWKDRNLIFRITGANIAFIRKTWPNAAWIGGAEDELNKAIRADELSSQTVAAKDSAVVLADDSGYKYARQPLPHQQKGFVLTRDREAFAILCEQGTGKTKIIIDNACYLYEQGKIDLLIVIAWPNGVHRNWVENELPEDMSKPYVAEFWTSNWRSKRRQKDFAEFIESDLLKVFTFNVEAFVAEGGQAFLLSLLKKFNCMLVIDQSASIKNPQAKRTKFLIDKASKQAKYRRILDGAPCAEGADELYSQFKFLDPMIIGHDTWTGFKAEFCTIGYFNEIAGYKNLDELHRRIDGYCYRVRADECQELPPRQYRRYEFELGAEERRIYDELKEEEIAFFNKSEIEEGFPDEEGATEGIMEEHNALVKLLRLQQVCCGWWPVDDFRGIEDGGPTRLAALEALLGQYPGEKCLIFSRFRADLEAIQRLFKKQAVSYHGGVNEEQRADNKRRFKTDQKCLYFLGHPRTAGIGHTLTEARHVIFYCNDPSLRLREECEKRAHRQGLNHQLHVWDLIARDTADSKVVRALRTKKALSDIILKDPSTFFLTYEN
jgi:Mesyanzhinovviridae DNA helicase